MARQSPARSDDNSLRNKWKKVRDELLTTLADLEDTTLDRNNSMRLQLEPHLATIDVDFSSWGGSNGSNNGSEGRNPSADATTTEDTKEASIRQL